MSDQNLSRRDLNELIESAITTLLGKSKIKVIQVKQAVVRGTTNPAPCCHLPNDTELLTA